MIEGSSRREISIARLVEYLGILGILRRKFVFDLLSCLGKSGGKCKLSDVGVILS